MRRPLLLVLGYLTITFLLILWSVVYAAELHIPVAEDTYLQEGYPDAVPSDNRNLYLGWDTLYGKKRTRPLLRFDSVTALPATSIISAQLYLYQYYPQASSSYEVDIYGLISSWSYRSSTWNNQPGPGRLLLTQRLSNGIGWEALDVTSLMREAITQGKPVVFQLRAANELKPGGVLWSGQCAFAPDEPRCTGETPYLKIAYDDTPPPVPVFDREPPITNGSVNTVEWTKVKDDYSPIVEYQLQASQSDTFTQPAESPWITGTYFEFRDLHEGQYYFRIRTRDQAGNVSAWSPTTSSYQDQNPPTIKKFSANPSVISPNGSTSRGVLDYTVIDLVAQDPSFDEGKLILYNPEREIVYEKTFTKQTETQHWPTTTQQKIPEGRYYLYYQVTDDFGHTRSKGPLTITIDNTAPAAPVIVAPAHNSLTNRRHVMAHYTQDETLQVLVVVDKRTITKTNKKSSSIELPVLAEGKHTITITNTDRAGNKGESTSSFTVDRTPPVAPKLELTTTNTASSLKIKGESNAAVIVTQNGRQLPTATLTRGQISYPVAINQIEENRYQWAVQLKDAAGNISKTSLLAHAIQLGVGTPLSADKKFPAELTPVECSIALRASAITDVSCSNLLLALRTVEGQATRSDWRVRLYAAGQTTMSLTTRYHSCAPLRWYDPRTWGCLSEWKETKQLSSIVGIPMVDTTYRSKRGTPQALPALWHGIEKTRLLGEAFTSNDLGTTSFWLHGQIRWYWFDQLTQEFMVLTRPYVQSNEVLSAKFPSREGVRPYLSWLFSSFVGVTQWHGKTAYQNPHNGIDFGVSRVRIYAPADGVIVSAGYDRYGGTCYQGGNYLGIKHRDTLYTYYFHLTSYANESKRTWRIGNTIKRGQQLGVSGNSGRFACQPLRDHLHFEVRTCRSAKCHTDPVPYFDVDWRKIPTLNSQQYPGRVQGDNPHPGK